MLDMCRAYDCASFTKDTEWDSFPNSVSSKWRLSRLTRGCADNDIYSVGWALSWIQIWDQRSRSDCRLKWRGRLCNYILHKLFADRTYFLGQCGAEHHDLFAVWCASKYFLYISAHICNNNCSANMTICISFEIIH